MMNRKNLEENIFYYRNVINKPDYIIKKLEEPVITKNDCAKLRNSYSKDNTEH